MTEFTVQVDFRSKDREADGRFTTRMTTVNVLAENYVDATLTAAQLVAATRPDHFMVTATRIVV